MILQTIKIVDAEQLICADAFFARIDENFQTIAENTYVIKFVKDHYSFLDCLADHLDSAEDIDRIVVEIISEIELV
mgnify:CR=1 FL=1